LHGEPRLRGGNRPKGDQEQRSTGLPKSTNLMHPQPYSHVADPLGGEHGSNGVRVSGWHGRNRAASDAPTERLGQGAGRQARPIPRCSL